VGIITLIYTQNCQVIFSIKVILLLPLLINQSHSNILNAGDILLCDLSRSADDLMFKCIWYNENGSFLISSTERFFIVM